MKPQVPLEHVAVALAGGTHAVHEVAPQLCGLVLSLQSVPQTWKPVLQVVPH
jgi:hypothetical protein